MLGKLIGAVLMISTALFALSPLLSVFLIRGFDIFDQQFLTLEASLSTCG
jgi:hypothetical protein